MIVSDYCLKLIKELAICYTDRKCSKLTSDFTPHRSFSSAEEQCLFFLLPNILIWDPLNEYKYLNSIYCPLCKEDKDGNVTLNASSEWETGQNSRCMPQRLWDVSWYTVLVGHIYKCSNGHMVSSYHTGILNQLCLVNIPFI